MQQVGIMYHGLSILGGGSILAGVILGATTTFIIDRDFSKASAFAAAGGVLTFLGLMHGEEVGAFENPAVVVAYFAVADRPLRLQPLRRGRPGAGGRGARSGARGARAGAGVAEVTGRLRVLY